jgi:hypothetical protein
MGHALRHALRVSRGGRPYPCLGLARGPIRATNGRVVPTEPKPTDDVSGAARSAAEPGDEGSALDTASHEDVDSDGEEAASIDPAPPEVSDLAAACVRFVAARYGTTLDYAPDTLSFVDQWLRDARAEIARRPEAVELVQSAAGAYLGEVIRRAFGGEWIIEGPLSAWRLCLSSVFCAFNPIGMAREALSLEPAEDWHAHFDLDAGERDAIEQRLEALPEVSSDEYYAPSTRFDVVEILVHALRAGMQARGLADVHFTSADYE